MLLSTVFLLSFSTLAFEVLLTRIFSIGQWNHLSFMVLSIALFGLAAGGTYLSVLDTRVIDWRKVLAAKSSLAAIIVLYSACTCFAYITISNIPLDYFRIPIEPIQSLYLILAYILLALPFFFSGLTISLAYTVVPDKTGLVYFASMTGSAIGAIFPAVMLSFLNEERLIILSALFPLLVVPFCFSKQVKEKKCRERKHGFLPAICMTGCLVILLAAAFLMSTGGFPIIETRPSPYKALSQILQYPDTRITDTATGIRGRIESVKTPFIRFAPGLSLKYTSVLPGQRAVFRDGDNQFVLYSLSSSAEARFAAFTLSYVGYELAPKPEKILLIENDGGLAIPCAIASGASHIRIAVRNPHLAGIVQNHYKLPTISQNPRAFLMRSKQRFDIIQLENWGASIAGADALTQDHLLTKNAFFEYLSHLAPQGRIIVSQKLLLPPANSIRVWATAYEALRMSGAENPGAHLAMLRNWDTFTLIVSAKPIRDRAAIQKFAHRLNFDLVYLSDMERKMANRFNVFKQPYHFLEINSLAENLRLGNATDYLKAYLLDVAPQSDDRPYPGRFLKWSRLHALYKSMGSRLYALLMSGEIVVSAAFAEALVVSIFLLMLPLFLFLKDHRRPSLKQIIYFLAVGAGFMFVELYFINRFVLLFGDPVVSFTVVVAAILIFSGLGGLWAHKKTVASIRIPLGVLSTVLVLTFIFIGQYIYHVLGLPVAWRYATAILLLLPAGILMGLPFPLGMQFLLQNSAQRSYAWSVNGCASVLTSIVSAQIAISFGNSRIMLAAVLAYILAFLFVPRR
jgi:hypothetical protein